MKLFSKLALVLICLLLFLSSAIAEVIIDPLNRDAIAPAQRTEVINMRTNWDTTWQNDPLVSPSVDPYVFTGQLGSYCYIKYTADAGKEFDELTASIAYIGGANTVEIRDANYNLVTSTTTTAAQNGSVWWYTVTFDAGSNTVLNSDLSALYVVVYYGSWGAAYSSIGTVELNEEYAGVETVTFQNSVAGYYEQSGVMMQAGNWGSAGYSQTGYITYGQGEMFFAESTTNSCARNLLKFNLEGLLPEEATIIRATLKLTLRTLPTPTPTEALQLAAFQAKKSWSSDDTYWLNWGDGGNDTNYCDFSVTDGVGSIPASASLRSEHSIDLSLSMVQDWIDTPWHNNGVLLRLLGQDGYQFYMYGVETEGTSAARYCPKLEIEFASPTGANRLTSGHRTLLKKGLQIAALMFPNYYDPTTPFSMARFEESNATNLDLCDANLDPIWIQDNPDVLWSRHSTWAVIQTSEFPYLKNLVCMIYSDEQDITDQTQLDLAKNRFAEIKYVAPHVINATNQEGGQFTYGQIRNYIDYVQPDMLMFDTYPFYGYYTTGGRPKHLHSHLGKYRQLGMEGLDGLGEQPIPYALYTQLFTSNLSPWLNHRVSHSEMWLNAFSAWTYGVKYLDLFIYQNQVGTSVLQSVMFNGDGDSNPTAEFYQVAEINRQSKNLSDALVRLISTDVRCIPGSSASGTNEIPDYTNSWSDANRPLVSLFTAVDNIDNLGSANDGYNGDIFVGFFKPMHESFDGPDYNNEVYFMVLNGLCGYTETTSQTRQTMRLRFDNSISQIQRLSRDTGLIETLTLTPDGGTNYYELELGGGNADLFKIDTGAPFVGIIQNPQLPGDANLDGMVDVGDLGILAANYGGTGKTWAEGDFNDDGAVDVGDLGILAANYGTGTSGGNWDADYAKAFGKKVADDAEESSSILCSTLGLPLIVGLVLIGLTLVKLEE